MVIGRTFCAALFLTALTLTLLHRAGPWPLIAAGVTFLRLLLMRREEKRLLFRAPNAKIMGNEPNNVTKQVKPI